MKQNHLTKKALGSVLALGLLTGLQGCTDAEIATALGAVAIGAGAVAIGVAAGSNNDGDNRRDHHRDRDYDRDRGHRRREVCEGGYVNRCTTYRDYYGDERHECRNEWDSCKSTRWDYYSNNELAMNTASIGSFDTFVARGGNSQGGAEGSGKQLRETAIETGKWAEAFKLSFESADFFTSSLAKAREGDLKALLDLGLSRDEILAMTRSKMPSDQSVDLLSRKLNQRTEDTRSMMKTLLTEGAKIKKEQCKKRAVSSRGSISFVCAN